MKRSAYTLAGAAMLSMALLSCEQLIDIDLPTPEQVLVVDGVIESNEFARVTVSRSFPYFEEINVDDIASLQEIFVTDATVILSDGLISDTLEFTIDPTFFPPVFYKGTDVLLKGQEAKMYYLTIYAEGDTMTSFTYIPQLVVPDSIYWKPDGDETDLGFGWGSLNDPDTTGNIYLLYAKRQGYPYYVQGGIMDDKFFNGQHTPFSFRRPNADTFFYDDPPEPDGERGYFRRGDTISVKFCTIERPAYDFIRTYNSAAASFGNPFAGPTFVKSNVTGGFGGFSGMACSYFTYIVPQ